ncbi:MAG: T9SS type A sorting domain-containing protein [Ignavibacteriaceae bacterium]|nr:T9SS type A sorting domain-containing protein [Ignavibacteriaceae bacterium]
MRRNKINYWISLTWLILAVNLITVFTTSAQPEEKRVYIIYPSPGAIIQSGQPCTIRWVKTSDTTSVNVYLIRDPSSGTTELLSGFNTNNFFTWNIPASYSYSSARIVVRINDNEPQGSDTSGFFAIARLKIFEPGGGSSYPSSTPQTIRLEVSNLPRISAKLQFFDGSGFTRTIFSNLSLSGSQQIPWITPDTANSLAKLIVYSPDDPKIADTTDYFTIYRRYLQLTYPSGSVYWRQGKTYTIRWSGSGVQYVRLSLSRDNGQSWDTTLINGNFLIPFNSGRFEWSIPSNIERYLASDSVLIRVADFYDPQRVYAYNTIPVKLGWINIETPNGGESVKTGVPITLKWKSSHNIRTVNVELLRDNIPFSISQFSGNNGEIRDYLFSVPSLNNKIRVSESFSSGEISDESDAAFTTKLLKILKPDSLTVTVKEGNIYQVKWIKSQTVPNLRIELLRADGSRRVLKDIEASDSVFYWNADEPGCGNNLRLILTDILSPNVADTSPVFKVKKLQVISPVPYVRWLGKSYKEIVWNSCPGDPVKVYFSSDGGFTYKKILDTTSLSSETRYLWHVDSVNTSGCKIKIIYADYPWIEAESGLFTIYYSEVSMKFPDGGETLQSGKAYTIRWNSTEVNYVKILFSKDDGNSWDSVLINNGLPLLAANGFYTWTVPLTDRFGLPVSSDSIRFKIYDIENPTQINDVTNGRTRICWINLTEPDGGEVFQVKRSVNVRWQSSHNVKSVRIDLVSDSDTLNRKNFYSNTGLYADSMDVSASQNARFLISDAASAEKYAVADASRNSFRIKQLDILSPNSNTGVVQAGSQMLIRWEKSADIPFVRIELLRKDGTALLLTAGTGQPTEYLWNITQVGCEDSLRIVIKDAGNQNIYDISPYFGVREILILAPNSTSNFLIGSLQQIRWTGCPGSRVRIEFKAPGLSLVIKDTITSPGVNVLDWPVSGTPGDSCYIEIYEINNPAMKIRSQRFRIYNSTLRMTSQLQNTFWQAGKTYRISWNSQNVSAVKLLFSKDQGANWDSVFINNGLVIPASQQFIDFTVPSRDDFSDPATDSGLVKIIDIASPAIVKDSSANIKIGWINILHPSLGIRLIKGLPDSVVWQASHNIRFVNIKEEKNNSAPVTLQSYFPNSGRFTGYIPARDGDDFTINIADTRPQNDSVCFSESGIYRVKSLELLYPKFVSGTYRAGDTLGIRFRKSENIGSLLIRLLDQNGITVTNISSGTQNDSVFKWVIGNDLCFDSLRIQVADIADTAVKDFSSYFQVKKIDIITPSMNESWLLGTSQQIVFNVCDVQKVIIQLSTNSGRNFSNVDTITVAPGVNNYSLLINQTPSDSCQFRIIDFDDRAIYAVSPFFRIYQGILNITYPNGFESWQSGNVYDIRWNSVNVNRVKILFSSDYGRTWDSTLVNSGNPINAGLGNYQYRVPDPSVRDISTDSALIRLVDADYPALHSDQSNQRFRIGWIKVIHPAANTVWQAGRRDSIVWESSRNISRVDITRIKGADTLTPPIIQSFTYLSGRGVYILNNIPSDPGVYNKILISDNGSYSSRIRSAGDNFRIKKLEILQPNLLTRFIQAGKSAKISWSKSPDITSLEIFLLDSTNNIIPVIGDEITAADSISWRPDSLLCGNFYRLLIRDKTHPFINDTSDFFSVRKLKISAPLAGARYLLGTPVDIYTSSCGPTQLLFEYRINPRSPFAPVTASFQAPGHYRWIPGLQDYISDSASIRVRDISSGNVLIADTTERFEVYRGEIQIQNPTQLSRWQSGKTYPIIWSVQNVGRVKIELSVDGGNSWLNNAVNGGQPISAQTMRYDFRVPDTLTSRNARIRISDYDNPSLVNNVVPGSFMIGKIRVISPGSGWTLPYDANDTIRWISNPNMGFVSLYLKSPAGEEPIAENIPDEGKYYARLGRVVSDSNKIIIRADGIDTSGNYFKVKKIELNEPVASLFRIKTRDTLMIRWNKSHNVQTPRIEILSDSNVIPGLTPQFIWADSARWIIPDTCGGEGYSVRVSDVTAANIRSSSAPFRIYDISVTEPVGGNNFLAGTVQTVRWSSKGLKETTVELSTNGGITFDYLLSEYTSADGDTNNIRFIVPYVNSDSCLIRVKNRLPGESGDNPERDYIWSLSSTFRIYTAALSINNDSIPAWLEQGKTYPVSWSFSNVASLNLYYSTDGGAEFTQLNDTLNPLPAAQRTFYWTIPEEEPIGGSIFSDSVVFRITDSRNPGLVSAQSQGMRRIGKIKRVNPEGTLNVWKGGDLRRIFWDKTPNVNLQRLDYGRVSGSDTLWSTIDTSLFDSHYYWRVPSDTTLDDIFFRVTEYDYLGGSYYSDISERKVDIKYVRVNSPNGNENIQTDKNFPVSFNRSYNLSLLKLKIKKEGSQWQTIRTLQNFPYDTAYISLNSSSFDGGRYKIGIFSEGIDSTADSSDNYFYLESLSFTTNLKDKILQSGRNVSINWSNTARITNISLFFDAGNGSGFVPIEGAQSLPASQGSFSWQVPAVYTNNARIKITDANSMPYESVSAGFFTIAGIKLNTRMDQVKYKKGEPVRISWQSVNIDTLVIKFDSELGSETIHTWVQGEGNFTDWIIPEDLTAKHGRIICYYPTIPVISDTGDLFTVCDINVTFPAEYQVFQVNSNADISFDAENVDSVDIYLTVNGVIIDTIKRNHRLDQVLTAHIFSHRFNNVIKDNLRVLITDAGTPRIRSYSPATFAVNNLPVLSGHSGYRKGDISLTLSIDTEENLNLLNREYKFNSGNDPNWYPMVNNFSQPLSNLSGKKTINFSWQTDPRFEDYEGTVDIRLRLRSDNLIEYPLEIRNIGVDNKGPVMSVQSLIFDQNPDLTGWNNVILTRGTPADLNPPVKLRLEMEDPLGEKRIIPDPGKEITLDNLKSRTGYNISLFMEDSLGNRSLITTGFSTKTVCDYDGNNLIDAYDLAAFRKSWREEGNNSADIYPYQGAIPKISVTGDDSLNFRDMFVLVKMWNTLRFEDQPVLPVKLPDNHPAAEDRELKDSVILISSVSDKLKIDLRNPGDQVSSGLEITYNPERIRIDSVITSDQNSFHISLNDSLRGKCYVDAVSFNHTLGEMVSYRLAYTALTRRSNAADSIFVKYNSYDSLLTKTQHPGYLYLVNNLPQEFSLSRNFPNPFNSMTTIEYDLPENMRVKLEIFNILGERVAELFDTDLKAGYYRYQIDMKQNGSSLSSGIYFYRLSSPKYSAVKKMVLLK